MRAVEEKVRKQGRQLLWFAGLWATGVVGLGAVAYGLRTIIRGLF